MVIEPDAGEFDEGPLVRTNQSDWEFSAARELRDWVEQLIEELRVTNEWTLVPGHLDGVFLGTFGRGTKTFRAALLLCDRGYGDQAAMLNRSLFEHMVVAWWMSVQEDSADLVYKLKRHHDHTGVRYERLADRFPELDVLEGEDAPVRSAEYVAELDREFKRQGGNWHGKSLYEMVGEVEAGWQEPYPRVLWKLFHVINQWNNYLLHHSSVGILEGIEWDAVDAPPRLLLGPGEAWTGASLWAAHWCYGLLVLCTLRRLSPDRANGFRDFFDDLGHRYRRFSREEVKSVGRNDACPCGSGRKFKNCHEQYVAN